MSLVETTTVSPSSTSPANAWTLGRIKWFNITKGYGFIERTNQKDVFLHVKTLRAVGYTGNLIPGCLVEFQYLHGRNGLHAANLRVPQT